MQAGFGAEMLQTILIWEENGPRPQAVLVSSLPRPQNLKFVSSSSRPEDELSRPADP